MVPSILTDVIKDEVPRSGHSAPPPCLITADQAVEYYVPRKRSPTSARHRYQLVRMPSKDPQPEIHQNQFFLTFSTNQLRRTYRNTEFHRKRSLYSHERLISQISTHGRC